ncbi:hypothetical protein [Leucobacter sp. GX0328]
MNIRLNDDELRLIRSARSGAETEMSDDEFARGLAAFERTIEASSQGSHRAGSQARRSRRRRRGLIWTGAGVVAVGALAGVALVATPAPVLSPVLGPATPKESHAEAVELLQRAADEALADGTELQPGQYLKMSCELTGISPMYTADGFADGNPPTGLMRVSEKQAAYVPDNDSAETVFHLSPKYDTEVVFGEYPDTESPVPFDGERALAPGEYQESILPPGQFFAGVTIPENPSELESVALRQWEDGLAEFYPDSHFTPEQTLSRALFPYLSNVMPREIRAEAFRLLSQQAGARMVALSEDDLSFDTAGSDTRVVAFEVLENTETQLVFDVERAQFIGQREVLVAPTDDYPNMQVGDTVGSSACTTSIVDEIPDIETWK